jgi:hypothetical protein
MCNVLDGISYCSGTAGQSQRPYTAFQSGNPLFKDVGLGFIMRVYMFPPSESPNRPAAWAELAKTYEEV